MARWLVLASLVVLACAGAPRRGPDVVIGDDADGTTVTLAAGQQLAVELRSTRSTGFDPWVLGTVPDRAVLELVRTERVPPARQLPGAGGIDRFVFAAVGSGTTQLAATARRPWEGGETVAFRVRVIVHR